MLPSISGYYLAKLVNKHDKQHSLPGVRFPNWKKEIEKFNAHEAVADPEGFLGFHGTPP